MLDCERMKYPFTGLYYFCQQLSAALQHTDTKNKICHYINKKQEHLFPGLCTIEQKSLHKLRLPVLRNFSIWHSTFQNTQYFPWKKRIKVILTIHDLNFIYEESKSEKKKKKYLQHLEEKIDRADHIIAISHYVLKDLNQNFDLSNKACSVIYNGCNISEVANPIPPLVKPDAPFLFSIGTVADKKNFHVLPNLLVNNARKLVISGVIQNEKYKLKISEEAKKIGVENRVIFTGPVSENDKQWYLKNCEAFLFPSLMEGFGLPVIEAMHFGKPVLLSSLTSLPEIGGDAAYYFRSFEPEEMRLVLDKSLAHYWDHNRSEEIKKHARFFDWSKTANQYNEVYQQLM